MAKIVPNQMPSLMTPDGTRMALVGEAPAGEEEIQGKPFVGSAGRELDKWFKACGLVRGQCYVGNLSQERAPDDEIGRMYTDSKCHTPNAKLQGWIDVLKEELEALRPTVVVALGRHPLYALTGKDGILKYWGSILPCTLVPGLKVIPIPHPSFIIRGMFALRPLMTTFLRRAVLESKYYGLNLPEREYVLNPPIEVILHHLDRMMDSPVIALDIERPKPKRADGKTFITHISLSDSAGWAMSIPFVRGREHRWHINAEAEILRALSRLLRGPALKIGHNLMFDFLSIADEWKIAIAPPYYCTMVAHNRCYPDLADKRLKRMKLMSLATCTAIYTREPYYKEDYKSENENSPSWRGSEEEFMLYNAKDSAVAFEIYEATKRDMTEFGIYKLFQKDMEVFPALAYMGLRGIRRDTEQLKLLQKEVSSGLIELQQKVNEVAGHELNVASPPQVIKTLYSERGNKIQFNEEGRPTTDEAALSRLRRISTDPLIPLIIQTRRWSKFDGTYLSSVISKDGRTRTTYNQARTTTFRISSSESVIGGGGNLQNIPSRSRPGEEDYNAWIKAFKKTFTADPGMVMGQCDYVQAEAMVVAYMSNDEKLIEDFRNDVDIHSRTAEQVTGIPYDEIRQGYLENDQEMTMRRYFGKKGRHGFNYKMSKRRLKEEFWKEGIYVEESEVGRMLSNLEAANPKTVAWWQEVEAQLLSNRTLTNPFGRRRYFMGIITDDTIREAIAFGPQSTVADLLNMAIRLIWKNMSNELELLLQIHDSVVWQSPSDLVGTHATLIKEMMAIPIGIKERIFTIPCDFKKGPSWGELA